jgi:hypothetical protein
VRRGVALGVSEIRTPLVEAYSTNSKMSGRFSGSPPVSTNTGASSAFTSSINRLASAVFSSNALRKGWAHARQCTQAKSQACVVSQITMNGR